MKKNTYINIYFIISFLLLTIFIINQLYTANNNAIFSIDLNLYKFIILLFFVSLFLLILTSDEKKIGIKYFLLIIYFCLFLGLFSFIRLGNLQYDIDTIISVQTIPFISNNGFLLDLVGHNSLIISATYSMPSLSILGSILSSLLEVSAIVIAKYLPLILTIIFFILFIIYINKIFGKKIALLSLIIIGSFPEIYNNINIFHNLVLAFPLMILSLFLLYMKCFDSKKDKSLFNILFILVVITFAFSHHLTYIIFVVIIFLLLVFLIFRRILDKVNFNINLFCISSSFLLTLILMFVYYAFIYKNLIVLLVGPLINQVSIDVRSITSPAAWDFMVIVTRLIYVFLISCALILSLDEIKSNFKVFIEKKYTLFLVIGSSIFALSIVTSFMRYSAGWGRFLIFGWFFFIPGIIALLCKYKWKKKYTMVCSTLALAILLFLNVFSIPPEMMKSPNDFKYSEVSFKNWLTSEELNSIHWLIKFMDVSGSVTGDEIVRRTFISNSENFSGLYSGNINQELINDKIDKNYIVFREENFYRIIGSFNSVEEPIIDDPNLGNSIYNNLNNNKMITKLYDDGNNYIFHL